MKLVLVLIICVFSLSSAHGAADTPNTRPNIVLIMADDLGYGDLGCFGCTDISTPNIDSIARDGVRLTQAYAYPVCSPTRAALMTGRYAENVGINGVLMGKSAGRFGSATIIAKLLHNAGYVTGIVGKWHLGYDGDVTPIKMGFDEFFGHLGGKIDYFKFTDQTQKGKHDLWEGDQEVFMEGYSTNLFSERGCKFIRDHAKQPFFLYMPYNAPHYSVHKGDYQAPDDYLKKFGVNGDPTGKRGAYAAMVNCMDDGIGRVLKELETQKLTEKTLVIFLSDNGSEDAGSNGPLSGGKHSTAEGGIRVPWLARWPGVIPKGTVRDDIVHVIDITPTLLAVTDTKAPHVPFDGINVWSAFINQAPLPERTLIFDNKTARNGKWKLRSGKLYDLSTDVAEKKDLAKQFPDVAGQLQNALEEGARGKNKK